MSASVGFEFAEQLGFECVLGNELNPTRAKWSQEKFPNAEVVQKSFTNPKIFSYLVRRFKEEGCRLATFSPNCQPYSKAGKQHLHSTEAFLFLYIIKFIKLTMAENAWIENALEFKDAVLDDDPRTVEQRKCGFLYELNGKDETFEEQFLSDGENGFMSRYALLFLISKTTNEKFLILLDEPETHFNEHWKRYFLKLLCDVLAKKNADVFVATHSAMLVNKSN